MLKVCIILITMREKKAQNILAAVQSTYNQIAEEFSNTRVHPGKEFEHFLPYLKPGAIVADIGCGNGRLVKWLQQVTNEWTKPAYKYTGIDNSAGLLAKAKELFPKENFMEGDQLNLPLDTNSVDIIFNIRAFHHLPSRALRLKALAEMRRVLKKDGIMVITVWNLWQKKYWKALFKAGLRYLFTLGSYAPNDTFIPWGAKATRYYHAFIPGELNKLVTNADFEIMELFSVQQNGQKVPFNQSHDLVIIAKNAKEY